jgi:hypothetical protein
MDTGHAIRPETRGRSSAAQGSKALFAAPPGLLPQGPGLLLQRAVASENRQWGRWEMGDGRWEMKGCRFGPTSAQFKKTGYRQPAASLGLAGSGTRCRKHCYEGRQPRYLANQSRDCQY